MRERAREREKSPSEHSGYPLDTGNRVCEILCRESGSLKADAANDEICL